MANLFRLHKLVRYQVGLNCGFTQDEGASAFKVSRPLTTLEHSNWQDLQRQNSDLSALPEERKSCNLMIMTSSLLTKVQLCFVLTGLG
jgi:hypothetical protein